MNEWQGKPKCSEETGPSFALSTTDATYLDQGSNPVRRSEKPATNRLSYGTAETTYYTKLFIEFSGLHAVSQETELFRITTVRVSNSKQIVTPF
jgi:hypothetical protein